MTVEKFIRILGYIVYVALWLPVIVLALVVTPIVWLVICARAGMSIWASIRLYILTLKNGIQHDMNFIRTGEW